MQLSYAYHNNSQPFKTLCLALMIMTSACHAHNSENSVLHEHHALQITGTPEKTTSSFELHLNELQQPLLNVLMLMRLSAKPISAAHNISLAQYNTMIEQWSKTLHEMTSITHAEAVLRALCNFLGLNNECNLTKIVTWEEQQSAVIDACESIKKMISQIKLTPYQQWCRTITQSHPLIRFSLAASAVTLTGALLYKFDNPLVKKVEKVFNNAFEWSKQQVRGTVSPQSPAAAQNTSLLDNNFAKGGLLIFGTACAAYFKEICDFVISPVKESIVDIQQRIHKFVSTQKNVKPRGPSLQSLPMNEIASHNGLRNYLERLAQHHAFKDNNLAFGIAESGGILLIGDPFEADRLAQATATLATSIAKNQPLTPSAQLATRLTAGYFGGPIEFPLQRYEATQFPDSGKKAFDMIKDLNTDSCIIIIHNLDTIMSDEQKAKLVQQLNSLNGLANDPLTRYFFIGVAHNKDDVPEALFNSPTSLFKDVYTLAPTSDADVLKAFIKTLNRLYLIEDTPTLRELFAQALSNGKNLTALQAAITRAAAYAAAQHIALTEDIIAEQLNIQ